MKSVVLVGVFPPPVHGMASVNKCVEDELRRWGTKVEIVDLSPGTLSRTITSGCRKLLRVLDGLWRLILLAFQDKVGAVYIGLSGGAGQMYEFAFILVSRFAGARVFIHHHSFAYIHSRNKLTALLVSHAGQRATHVLLCDRMKAGLETTYGVKLPAIVLSNFAFPTDVELGGPVERRQCRTIGYLSNILPQKGIGFFLDLIGCIRSAGLNIKGVVAGPFGSAEMERTVMRRLKNLGGIEYRGAVYGASKVRFFSDVDLIIFPSQYVHEAEPVTVIEALTAGVPVITSDRGCLPSLVRRECGLVLPVDDRFSDEALIQIRKWVEKPDEYRGASRFAARYAQQCRAAAREALLSLCDEISRACELETKRP
jgi:glycosyltransferase involved in cell wall biosynthesis